jgi:hypothetical protein
MGELNPQSPLDPSHYIEHVTRTALLLERLALDVRALKDQVDRGLNSTESLRKITGDIERDLAVFKVSTSGIIATNREAIEVLTERLRWLSRLVLGAFVTGIIAGIVTIIFKANT